MIPPISLLEHVLTRARPFVIIAPPRSSSTALARTLFQHSEIGPYIHEPCDQYCHHDAPISSILERLAAGGLRTGALIKEMTFQMGDGAVARSFLRGARKPVIFLVRHPQLSIHSRLRMVLLDISRSDETSDDHCSRIDTAIDRGDYGEVDDIVTEEVFPLSRTGWSALKSQLEYCRREHIDYLIVNANDFRSLPRPSIEKLCTGLGVPFEQDMLEWGEDPFFHLGGLDEQDAWYRQVMQSTGVLPEADVEITVDRFPSRFRDHVREATRFYEHILAGDVANTS